MCRIHIVGNGNTWNQIGGGSWFGEESEQGVIVHPTDQLDSLVNVAKIYSPLTVYETANFSWKLIIGLPQLVRKDPAA
jgi:hypothetical protein